VVASHHASTGTQENVIFFGDGRNAWDGEEARPEAIISLEAVVISAVISSIVASVIVSVMPCISICLWLAWRLPLWGLLSISILI
jgi:hypothetical protein